MLSSSCIRTLLLDVFLVHAKGFQLVPKKSKGEKQELLLETGQTFALHVSQDTQRFRAAEYKIVEFFLEVER